MATVVHQELLGCDGFRVESASGLVGWVEEIWLGPSHDPAAVAVRTVDGRRGLLLADEIETVIPEHEDVRMKRTGRLLELDVPRVASSPDGDRPVSASWQTTGETLEPPTPPGPLQLAVLALRPWRLAPPPRAEAERPMWQQVAVLYTVIGAIVVLVIALAFIVARIATGAAY
jgi:hypothetical protein